MIFLKGACTYMPDFKCIAIDSYVYVATYNLENIWLVVNNVIIYICVCVCACVRGCVCDRACEN